MLGSEGPEGGFVGGVSGAPPRRERDGEIVDGPHNRERRLEIFAVLQGQRTVAQHARDVAMAADHRRRGYGAHAFEPGESVGGVTAKDREVGVSTAGHLVAAGDLGLVDHRQS